jgi:histidinol-phosphate aminotransferase
MRSGVPYSAVMADDGLPRPLVNAPVQVALNENPFGCSPLVRQAIRSRLTALHRHSEEEADGLVALIASNERVSTDQVVVGDVLGALGRELSLASRRCRELLHSTPGYTQLAQAAEAAGGAGMAIPLDGRLENDLEEFAARVTANTWAAYLVNPHNPSGTVGKPEAFLDAVRELSNRTLVIVDEAYLEFTEDFAARTTAPLVRAGHDVICLRTFSKVHGLAGLRLSYAILPAPMKRRLAKWGGLDPHRLDLLAVLAATTALRDEQFVCDTRRRVGIERIRWERALDRLGLRHSESRANFVFFETALPHATAAAQFLARNVCIGRAFQPLDRWVRISVGLPEENTAALAALEEIFRH